MKATRALRTAHLDGSALQRPFVYASGCDGLRRHRGGRVNDCAQVISTSWAPLPGLYACGEMVGGLFHGNYPGGTGLMSGAVRGRLAGARAAAE
jgi:tricarballylate dehydrogenase